MKEERRRKLDYLGRFTIPKIVVDKLEFEKFQELEIIVEYGKICLRKFDSRSDVSNRPYLGIVRRIDEANHIMIPVEYRNLLFLNENGKVNWKCDYDNQVVRVWGNDED